MLERISGYIAGRIWKKLILPSICTEICAFIATNFVAFFLISRYCAKDDLIVYSAFIQMFVLFCTIDVFFGDGAGAWFAICKGESNSKKAQHIFSENLTAFLSVISLFYLLLCWQMPTVVQFLKLPPELYPRAITYGRILAISGIFNGIVCILQDFVHNDSLPKMTAAISFGALGALIVPTIVFLGFFRCGIIAYALIQLSVYTLEIIALLIPFLLKKTSIRLRLKWMTCQTFREIFAISCGQQIYMLVSLIVNVFFMRWMLSCYGPAAATISALIETVVAFYIAFNKPTLHAMQSITGIFRGEKNYPGMRFCFQYAWKRGITAATLLGVLVYILAPRIVQWMPVQENYPGEAITALHVMAVVTPFLYTFQFIIAFYNVSGHNRMISIISLLAQGILYPLIVIVFFFVVKKESLFWYYFIACVISYLLLTLCVVWIIKNKKHYGDLLLLPMPSINIIRHHFLIKNNVDDFAKYQKRLLDYLHQVKLPEVVTGRVKHLFEELLIFAVEHSGKQSGGYFAVAVMLYPGEKLEISLRFDSNESCLNSVLNGQKMNLPPEDMAGAMILKKMSDNIYIDRIYGFNYILLTIKKGLA